MPMRKRRIAALILASALSISLLAGCGNEEKPGDDVVVVPVASITDKPSAPDTSASDTGLLGRWAYVHDTENAALVFETTGYAVLDGEPYTYEYDDQFIKLTAMDGTVTNMRYVADNKGMYIYKHTTYTYTGSGAPNGLIGNWECKEKKWLFEFSDKGTFMEDGYFPGYYSVDEENGTFKLMYNDHFEDTECYYSIDGNELSIEYPWRMVKM